MTFPCKEELVEFEGWAAEQKQIYPDAADAGIKLGDLCITKLERMRYSLNELLKMFKKPEYDYSADSWHGGNSVSFFIPIEIDGNQERGIYFRVAFCRDNKVSGGGFISIDICSRSRDRK